MVPTGKEATDFVHASEAIHALLASRPLAPNERDLIEFIGSELLVKSGIRPHRQTTRGAT